MKIISRKEKNMNFNMEILEITVPDMYLAYNNKYKFTIFVH